MITIEKINHLTTLKMVIEKKLENFGKRKHSINSYQDEEEKSVVVNLRILKKNKYEIID